MHYCNNKICLRIFNFGIDTVSTTRDFVPKVVKCIILMNAVLIFFYRDKEHGRNPAMTSF
jgi:hypothetical protein